MTLATLTLNQWDAFTLAQWDALPLDSTLIAEGFQLARNILVLNRRIAAARRELAENPLVSKKAAKPVRLQISAWERDRSLFQRRLCEYDVEIPACAGRTSDETGYCFSGGVGYYAFMETAELERLIGLPYGSWIATPKGGLRGNAMTEQKHFRHVC